MARKVVGRERQRLGDVRDVQQRQVLPSGEDEGRVPEAEDESRGKIRLPIRHLAAKAGGCGAKSVSVT